MAVKRKDATAMDDLIEKITREVMNRMSSQSSAPAVVPTASRRVLVVISGAVKAADTVFAGLKSLSLKGWKLTGVLTTSAENIWGADRLSAAAGFQQCLTGNVFNLAHELLRNHEAVVLAVPSINTLAKVASLTCDNPATAILHEAILNGVPVLVVVDSLNAAVATAAPAVKRRVQELINTVSSYGARPISLGELADVRGGGCPPCLRRLGHVVKLLFALRYSAHHHHRRWCVTPPLVSAVPVGCAWCIVKAMSMNCSKRARSE